MSSISKTGKMVIKPGKISYKILQWMQEHEGTNALKNTTGHQIAEKIVELPGIESGEVTIEQVFSKMVKTNVVYRDKHDKSIYSDYRINYWHKSIPADILANAPVEVKRAMANAIDKMKPDQYMDDEGCVVTPNAVEKVDEDPFNESAQIAMETSAKLCGKTLYGHELSTSDENIVTTPYIPKEPGTFENPIVEDQYPWEEGGKDDEEEGTTTIPLHITKEKDGKTTNVTINLTINI